MKKFQLTLVPLLACFLVFNLIPNVQCPRAKSQSGNFEMVSDVLCGTGGESQSTTFTLKVSAGAQPSPIGQQSSTNFDALAGWVYTSQPSFTRGDANGDGVINSADVVYLINYLFTNGPAPCPQEAGDANCDGVINSADVVYLINYLFTGGPPPSSADEEDSPSLSPTKLNNLLWKSKIGFSSPNLQKKELGRLDDCFDIPIWGKFQQDLAAIELEIEYDPAEVTLFEPKLTSLTQGLSIFFGGEEGIQKIGVLDLTGKNPVPSGEGELVILKARGMDPASIEIKRAVLVNREARMLSVETSSNLQAKMEKRASETPDNFSLSQNYPNPFNPQTSIAYALSKDTEVKLTIYNMLGQKVRILVDGFQTAGYKQAHWDGTNQKGEKIASGVYFYRLETNEFSQVRKMMLVK